MKKILKRGLASILALVIVMGLLPAVAFAQVDSSGKPLDANNELVVALYTGDTFPGEPAVHDTSDYDSFNSSFNKITFAWFSNAFASNASSHLLWSEIKDDLVQGVTNGATTVWGVYDTNGLEHYFDPNSTILLPASEAKMIRAVKSGLNNKTDEQVLAQYEIIWYVIKLQHTSGWGNTEWHLNGLVKERNNVSVNYYGNGNTSGDAPDGTYTHTSGNSYTIAGPGNMEKVVNGKNVQFLGWNTAADGSGTTYQPNQVINSLTENLTLYAMWDNATRSTATVNLHLDGARASASRIFGMDKLYLSADGSEFHLLNEDSTGVYSAEVTNGAYHLYGASGNGNPVQIGNRQLTIYNQDGTLDVFYYSVSYDANGGNFANNPGTQIYAYGETVTAVADIPTMDGYIFLGWEDGNGNLIQPGATVTNSITAATVLTAKWEKTVSVKINVTIDHQGSSAGVDKVADMRNVVLDLVSRATGTSAYLETGDVLELSPNSDPRFTYEATEGKTKYTAIVDTFSGLPGGTAEYSVVASKSGYDTSVKTSKVGDTWIIDVEMIYRPTNFDLEFTVNIKDEGEDAVPEQNIPVAVIVKVTFWSDAAKEWQIITQHENGNPGVRVNIDPETLSGTGKYPVWKYVSGTDTPYGYRVRVTAFVYPDGTIVPVGADSKTSNVKWIDEDAVYTATHDEVNSDRTYGGYKGAYVDAEGQQLGELTVQVGIQLNDVFFNANGGTLTGEGLEQDGNLQKLSEQYKLPDLEKYIPTRGGGYIFDGWYVDETCTERAISGADLTGNTILYAKWINPLAIQGTVTISGTYKQGNDTVNIHDIDKAKEAIIVLEELRNGVPVEVATQPVQFGEYGASQKVPYSFSEIPNDGKQYQIHVLLLNYTTLYDNERDADPAYSSAEYEAYFGGDDVAEVNVYLYFVPPAENQNMIVDASAIGEGFRPTSVHTEVVYRDVGDNHPFQVISQHTVSPYGVTIALDEAGNGQGVQSVWKWHIKGTVYDYQMNITLYNGDIAYDSDTAPFDIVYGMPTHWDSSKNAWSGDMKATLIPKQYPVIFDLNAGEDDVGGMDAYWNQQANAYVTLHEWSKATPINANPTREGYRFLGWVASQQGVYDANAKQITADTQTQVVLTAQWEKLSYQVSATADPAAGGKVTGAGTYEHGTSATVMAEANYGYYFLGWYDGETKVFGSEAYTFTVTSDRNLTAMFAKTVYEIVAAPSDGGSTSGGGFYTAGEQATVTATPASGHIFQGWYEGDKKVSDSEEYTFTVTGDRTLTARFIAGYTITVIAEQGGTATGGGVYAAASEITLTAVADEGYYFVGWYDEFGNSYDTPESINVYVRKDLTLYARFNPEVTYTYNYVYIFGYTDTILGAEGPLERGELAQMIYRLVRQEKGASHQGGKVFEDTAGEWFQTGISYMAKIGAIDQRQTNAYPYATVSYGEAYKMICLGLGLISDTQMRWREYGTILCNAGYLSEADLEESALTAKIKRWQFCELFNEILGRTNADLIDTDGNEVTAETYNYTDLSKSDPYYKTMLIAASTFTEDGYVDVKNRASRDDLDAP